MAVANAWTTGHSAVSLPQLRPSSSSSLPSSSSSSSFENCLFSKKRGVSMGLSKKNSVRQRKNSVTYCLCAGNSDGNSSKVEGHGDVDCFSSKEWDWNRWNRHFSEIDQAESFASVLKFQLEDAIEKEDFQEAAKLKTAIAEATSKDTIAEIMSKLKSAITEERYHEASRLSRSTGSGLVGWWVGYSKDSNDPFGQIIRIAPGMGRFVGRSYSPRQLVTSSPGTPLFEIFVVKDADGTYNMQVVFLQRANSNSATNALPDNSAKGPSAPEIGDASVVDVKLEESETEKSEADKTDEKSINLEGAAEEGIKSVINFLKEKIPELKVKVMKINVAEEITEDGDSLKQLLEEDNENAVTSEKSEDDGSELDDDQGDQVAAKGDSDTLENEKDLDMKLFIGGVLHNKEDNTKDEYTRVPADLKEMKRDSFVLHIPKSFQDHDTEENIGSKVKVAAIAAQGISELMPPDVAKAFWNVDKVSSKVSRNVREIVKLAVSQAQKRNKLSENTEFSRITPVGNNLDPFDGLYVGAFGPYDTEIVQLKRKYGNWNLNNEEKSSDVEFFEYVEAVKLTGDLNVPAGQVTFRAKIGKGSRVSNRGMYPDELGVVASYKGQGRIAEFGFKNPKWVDGELLQLNGKGMGPYVKGADLGFLYVVPEQSFLVLFNHLKLPE